jgi:outer membrane protein TolC
MMKRTALFCVFCSLICAVQLAAQEAKQAEPRHTTLEEAVQLALKHNHVVRIAGYSVQEKERSKDIARSSYFPILRNDSNVAHVTDTQFIGISAGALGPDQVSLQSVQDQPGDRGGAGCQSSLRRRTQSSRC